MKKILFIILAIFFNTWANTQDDELPAKVNEAFNLKYPKAKNVYWDLEDNNYKIEFEIFPDTYTAFFSETGKWFETAKIISDPDIPEKAVTAINKEYPDFEIYYSEYVENQKGEKFYRINSYAEDADYTINVTGEGIILNTEKKVSAYDSNEE